MASMLGRFSISSGTATPRLVLKLYAHATDDALGRAAEAISESYWSTDLTNDA